MKRIIVEVVNGVEGPCLTIGNYTSGQRVCGPKPWGGGKITHTFECDAEEISEVIEHYAFTREESE